MTLQTERTYPWVAGAVVAAATVHWVPYAAIKDQLPAALGDALTISSIIVGFFGTSATILVGMTNRALDAIRQSGYWNDLLRYLWMAIWSALILVVVSLIMRFVVDVLPPRGQAYAFGTWTGVLVWMLLNAYRMIRVLRNILASTK